MGVAYLDLSLTYLQNFVIATLYNFTFVGGAQLDDALRYKPGGRGYRIPMVSLEFFISDRTIALGSTQSLTEISTRNAGALG